MYNRVKSLTQEADLLRRLVPEARILMAHGQMPKETLRKNMLDFFHHKYDILVTTTIIESGLDLPLVNTMIVHRADRMGLSQLYQLRGRIGRSHQRAFCYLFLPETEEEMDSITEAFSRLHILQEHSHLGSGLEVAQYDLEMRGAGDILGEAQSGHVEAVGYELYLDLLNEALQEAKGESKSTQMEPELNVPLPAYIPSEYIENIRLRLQFYRKLSTSESLADIDQIEEAMRDQFGPPPLEVQHLYLLMNIRLLCKAKGIQHLSVGPKNLSLLFVDQSQQKVPIERLDFQVIEQALHRASPSLSSLPTV